MKHRPEFLQLEDRLVPTTSISITVVDPPPTLFEGVAISLNAGIVDPVAPTFTWTVLKNGVDVGIPGGSAADFSFTPDDNASYTVNLSVTDGADTFNDSEVLTVVNQVPVAAVSGPTSGDFGTALTFTLTATDPSSVDTTAGFIYAIDWNNDGTPDETTTRTPGNGAGVSVTHTFDHPGVNTFSVTATDKDNGTSLPVTYTVTIANGAAVVNGVLYVAGTAGDDVIRLVPKGKPTADNANIKVLLNGVNLGVFSGVNSINIVGLDGNDSIHLAGAIRVDATIDGGAGNDRIKGGKGADLLIGGDGDDWLNGHQGKDVLIGGAGSDRLIGGPGDDLLIGGNVSFATDTVALESLRLAWSGPGSYDDRVAALMDATAAVHLVADGTSPTVTDDGSADRLTGAAGKDWFFATGSDTVTDRHHFEFLNGAKGTAHGKPGHGGHGGHGNGH